MIHKISFEEDLELKRFASTLKKKSHASNGALH